MIYDNVYFFNGTAYAGKSTMVKRLAEKYNGIACEENYHDALLEGLSVRAPWRDAIQLPGDCELAVREKDGERYFFVLNYGWQGVEIELKRAMTDVDDGREILGWVALQPFETKVYRQ